MAGLEDLKLSDSWRLPPEDGRFGSVNTHNPDSKPAQPTVKPGLAAGTLPIGTIARDATGQAVYVLQSDGHWKTYDGPQSGAAATKVTDLPEYEYRIEADGKTWHLLTKGNLLDEAFKPVADASRNAGHEEPYKKHENDFSFFSASTQSASTAAAPSAPVAAQAGPAGATSASTEGPKTYELPPADQKTLKEWAAKIDKNSWLAQNPAEKAFAKTVNKAVATNDWSEVAGLHPNMPAFRKSVEAWHNHANAEHARTDARSKTKTWDELNYTRTIAENHLEALRAQHLATPEDIQAQEQKVDSLREKVKQAGMVADAAIAKARVAEAKAGLKQADLF